MNMTWGIIDGLKHLKIYFLQWGTVQACTFKIKHTCLNCINGIKFCKIKECYSTRILGHTKIIRTTLFTVMNGCVNLQ